MRKRKVKLKEIRELFRMSLWANDSFSINWIGRLMISAVQFIIFFPRFFFFNRSLELVCCIESSGEMM